MIRSLPLPDRCQPSTVRLTVFVHTSQGLCLLGFVKSLGNSERFGVFFVAHADCQGPSEMALLVGAEKGTLVCLMEGLSQEGSSAGTL